MKQDPHVRHRATVPRQLRLRRRYTRVVKLFGTWNAFLMIDHQSFCVADQTTKKRAQWFARMLAIALDRMIENEKANDR